MQGRLPFDIAAPGPGAAPGLYFVRHVRARRYLIRVEPTGRIRVTIPRGGSRREAEAFVVRQRSWIDRQLLRIPARGAAWSPEERTRLRHRASNELPPQLLALAGRHGLQVSKVTIRNQRSRWGSCGADGHITLNWRLMAMPDWVREYVMVHELMHLRVMNHSPEYWALVAEACPDYASARRWLRLNAPSIA